MPLQETTILFKPGFALFYYLLEDLEVIDDADGSILVALQPAFPAEKE
jgi:hypothetical protein